MEVKNRKGVAGQATPCSQSAHNKNVLARCAQLEPAQPLPDSIHLSGIRGSINLKESCIGTRFSAYMLVNSLSAMKSKGNFMHYLNA